MFTHENRNYTQFGCFLPCRLDSATKTNFKFVALDDLYETHPNHGLLPSELELITEQAPEWRKLLIPKGSFVYTMNVDSIVIINGISCVNIHLILLVEPPRK